MYVCVCACVCICVYVCVCVCGMIYALKNSCQKKTCAAAPFIVKDLYTYYISIPTKIKI